MPKKKIAFILQGGQGGTHEYIKMLLSNLDENKYDITVVCHGEVYYDLKELGYKAHYVEMVRNISPVRDFMALIRVLSFLKKNKTDIVYSHSSKAGTRQVLSADVRQNYQAFRVCIYRRAGHLI